MSSSILFTLVATEADEMFITVYAPGHPPLPADQTHPNFDEIKRRCIASTQGEDIDADDLVALFDVASTVREKFSRLTDRITVTGGAVLLDGDPVHGTLQDQIMDFLDRGEDFTPLVLFYEKLVTNPLGDVREGLYDWIMGQREAGTLTITPEGNVIGYKAVYARSPEWRTSESTVYVPSRRGEGVVNDREVSANEYIEQVVGDTVEMPRSKVLHAPSQACGDGLHIGTYQYAVGFGAYDSGHTVMAVEFNPRDIVSLPDSNASFKLRVCRYRVLGPVTEPYDMPVYQAVTEPSSETGPQTQVEVPQEVGQRTFNGKTYRPLTELDFGYLQVGDLVEYWGLSEVITSTTPECCDYEVDGFSHLSVSSIEKAWRPVAEDFTDLETGTEVTYTVGTTEPYSATARIDRRDTGGSYDVTILSGVTEGRPGMLWPHEITGILTTEDVEPADMQVGDEITDRDGDVGIVTEVSEGTVSVDYSDNTNCDEGEPYRGNGLTISKEYVRSSRRKTYSGPTSEAAKGRGLNPAQDPKTGRFEGGRPGSQRDPRTGRFAG